MDKENELTTAQKRLLMEATRRYLQFHPFSQGFTEAWTGLGTYTTYKPVYEAGLMVPHDRKLTKRVKMWWVLTPKGAEIVKGIIAKAALENIYKTMGYPDDMSTQYQLFPVK